MDELTQALFHSVTYLLRRRVYTTDGDERTEAYGYLETLVSRFREAQLAERRDVRPMVISRQSEGWR